MNFSTLFQLKDKKSWWVDVIFYFAVSLLVATLFCYGIFLLKNGLQKEEIKKETEALKTVGTTLQKAQEKEVLDYKTKISEFTNIFKNHEFASNAFAFMQMQTVPDVWFKQFSLDRKSRAVQLSGESEDMNALSRQVLAFETNKYVKNIGALNSSLGDFTKTQFNLNLDLQQDIFTYLPDLAKVLSPEAEEEEEELPAEYVAPPEQLIRAFRILLNPPVMGTISAEDQSITLDVPQGTDVTNLNTSVLIVPGATVSPLSNTPQDFTKEVVYTVTTKDNLVKEYKVKVNILEPEEEVVVTTEALPEPVKPKGNGTIFVVLGVIIVLASAGFGAFWYKKRRENLGKLEIPKKINQN